ARKYGVSYEDVKRARHHAAWVEAENIACQNEETPEHMRWRAANRVLARKIKVLLQQFYEGRTVPSDVQLEVSWHIWGVPTLHSGGKNYRSNRVTMSDQNRDRLLEKLRLYQSEMAAFTGFLECKYFSQR